MYKKLSIAVVFVVLAACLVVVWRWQRSPKARFDAIMAGLDSKYDPRDVAARMTEVISLDPRFVDAYIERSKAFRILKRYDACYRDCDTASRLDPHRPEPFFIRGVALIEQKKLAEAVKACDQAVALDGNSWPAHFLRGKARRQLHQFPEALADLNAALAKGPNESEILLERALTYVLQQDATKALPDLDRALDLGATKDVYIVRALALFQLDEHGRAEAEFARADFHQDEWEGITLPFVRHLSRPAKTVWDNHEPPTPEKTVVVQPSGPGKTIELGNIPDAQFAAISPDATLAIVTTGNTTVMRQNTGGAAFLYTLPDAQRKTMLSGHRDAVVCAAFAPKGPVVATGSWDGSVRLFSTAEGSPIASLECGSRVEVVAFSPDGKLLAAGCDDGTLRLWTASTHEPVGTYAIAANPVFGIAFSPQSVRLAVGGGDEGQVVIWDVAAKAEAGRLAGIAGCIRSVAWSPDGASVAAASMDHSHGIWDVKTRRLRRKIVQHESPVTSVSFTADSEHLASAAWHGNNVYLWNAADGTPAATLQLRTLEQWERIQFSADGKWLITAGQGKVTIWDNAPGSPNWSTPPPPAPLSLDAREITSHTGPVWGVAFARDGTWIASASSDNSLRIWDRKSLKNLKTIIGAGKGFSGVSISGDGALLAAARSDNDTASSTETTIDLWRTSDWKHLGQLPGRFNWTTDLRFCGGAKRLLASYSRWKSRTERESELALWDVGRQEIVKTLALHGGYIESFDTDPAGKLIAVPNGAAVAVYDVDSQNLVRTLTVPEDDVKFVRIAADGKTLVAVTMNGFFRAWNLKSGKVLAKVQAFNELAAGIAVSADGSQAACGAWNGRIAVVDLASGEIVDVLHGHRDYVHSLDYAPDGKLLISSGGDAQLRLWSMDRTEPHPPWSELAKFKYPGKIKDLRLSPDGKRLAVGGTGKKIAVFDLAAQPPRLRWLEGHQTEVQQLEFLRGGQSLLSAASGEWDASLFGEVKLWDVDSQNPPIEIGQFDCDLHNVAVSKDESLLVTAHLWPRCEIRLWDLPSRVELPKMQYQPMAYCAGLVPGERRLLTSGGADICAWDLPANDRLAREPAAQSKCRLRLAGMHLTEHGGELSPNGQLLFGPCTARESAVIDLAAEKLRFFVHGQVGAFSSDGRILATSDGYFFPNQVSLWDTESGRLLGTLRGAHGLAITRLLFILEDHWIVSANSDGTIRFWPVAEFAARK